jgi:hypothetical protein
MAAAVVVDIQEIQQAGMVDQVAVAAQRIHLLLLVEQQLLGKVITAVEMVAI